MRESENGEEGERRTPEGEGDGELLSRRKLFQRDRARMGARASQVVERGSDEEREKRERGRRSSPPASPRDRNSVAGEGARRRD